MTTQQKTSPILNILLWIAQILLAATFIWAGCMKIFLPEQLPFPWVKDNENLVLFTGLVDLLGGLGILLPSLLRIQPKLTIYAAYGILVLMVFAIVFHVSRGEAKDTGFNVFVMLLAAFVAIGRKNKAVITAK